MGNECYISLFDAHSKSLAVILLDSRCTQLFWDELCDKTYKKQEFIEILKNRVGSLDINSDEFPLLIKVFSDLLTNRELINTESVFITRD